LVWVAQRKPDRDIELSIRFFATAKDLEKAFAVEVFIRRFRSVLG
jgi:hypothetical protein